MIINGVEIMLNVLKDWPNSIHFGLETGRWFNWIGLTLLARLVDILTFVQNIKWKGIDTLGAIMEK